MVRGEEVDKKDCGEFENRHGLMTWKLIHTTLF